MDFHRLDWRPPGAQSMITYPTVAGGIRTRVLEAGDGDRTVLLVHGLAARADRWRNNLDALATAGYHVYALDLPGHGFADKGPELEYSVPAFSRFVGAFLDSIGAQTATLVGTSLGGHSVGWFASENPGRVDALVIVAGTGLVPLGREKRAQTRDRVGDASIEGVTRKLAGVVYDHSLLTAEWIAEESRINSSPGASEAFVGLGEYFFSHLDDDLITGRLESVTTSGTLPLLIVWGAHDAGYPVQWGKDAHRQLSKSSLVVIDHAGHAPYFERPEDFNNVLLDFLDGHLGRWKSDCVSYE